MKVFTKLNKILRSEKGSIGVSSILLAAAIIIFLIFPIFAVSVEFYIAEIIGDSVTNVIDLAVVSAYISLIPNSVSESDITINTNEFISIFEYYFKKNLNLNEDFSPADDSLIDGTVQIVDYNFFYGEQLPYTDPDTNKIYNRPFIEVSLILPVKPHLYLNEIIKLSGKEYFDIPIKHKVTLPIDN